MASAAIPPHQDISAPLMAMTPLTIWACAGSAATRSRLRAIGRRYIDSSSTVWTSAAASRQLLVGSKARRLHARAMIFFQLAVGGCDRCQLACDRGELVAGHGIVELLVAQLSVNTVADTAQAGHAGAGAHGKRNGRAGGPAHQRRRSGARGL